MNLGAGLCPRLPLGTGHPRPQLLSPGLWWKETAPNTAGPNGLVRVPRREDFLQGRDFVIPIRGLGWGWGDASQHFSFQVLCTTSQAWSLEKASQSQQMPLGDGSRAPPCGCSHSTREVTRESQSEPNSWEMLQIQASPTSSRTPSPPLPHPFNTVP